MILGRYSLTQPKNPYCDRIPKDRLIFFLPVCDDVQMLSCEYRARTSPLHYIYKQRAVVVLLLRHDTNTANNNPSPLPASPNIQPLAIALPVGLPGRSTWENLSCVSTDMMKIILCFKNYVHNVHANILMCCIVREVNHMRVCGFIAVTVCY